MRDSVALEISVPDEIVGSAAYTVVVSITNSGPSDIARVEVEPQVLPGRLLSREIELRNTEESDLEARRRALILEMEAQVARAYERQVYRGLNAFEQVMFALIRAFDIYAALFSRRSTVPSWTNEAFRITDWEDVEVLEREIVTQEPQGSKLRTAFEIDKGKLRRCITAIEESANDRYYRAQDSDPIRFVGHLPICS